MTTLKTLTQRINNRLEETLMTLPPSRLRDAMHYAVCKQGKRLRPLLTYTYGLSLNCSLDELDPVAESIEFIHCYSLIHDDLPAMDDDDWRRGMPSCHRAFGEGIAILAGDALQSLALDRMHPAGISILAQASLYMAQGQAWDIHPSPEISPEKMMLLKTAELFATCFMIPAQIHQHSIQNARECGLALGLSYQIQDDLQDDGTESAYVQSVGIKTAQTKLISGYQQALEFCSHPLFYELIELMQHAPTKETEHA